MNERTHFFIKNIPLTLYSRKGMFLVCERWVGDGDRLPHIDPKLFFRIPAGLLNRGSLRAQALCLELVLTPLASYLQLKLELTPTATGSRTDPSRLWHLVIFLFDIHLLPVGIRICHHVHSPRWYYDIAVLPLIYTGASLDWRLGRRSICYNLFKHS